MNHSQFPAQRIQDQRYVYFMLESPAITTDLVNDYSIFSDFFNWTMTYRRDSDVIAPYGLYKSLIQGQDPESVSKRVKVLPKTKQVAWVSSHCITPSKREDYVSELGKYIKVDVFGKCGDKICSGDRINNGDCRRLLEKDYKFYLSFENSECVDYVTEKFFMALDMDIVPVVLGGANYSVIAPPGSFIDTKDFASPRHLANELKRLAAAEEEDLDFFRWKSDYQVEILSFGPIEILSSIFFDKYSQGGDGW